MSMSKDVFVEQVRRKKIGTASRLRWADPEYKARVGRKISVARRGVVLSERHRQSLRTAQNRPDVAERKRRAMSGERNPHWLGDAASGNVARARARRIFREECPCERCVAGVPGGGGKVVRHHEDENPRNNVAGNIRWFCQAHHALLHRERGVNHLPPVMRGEENPSAKITKAMAEKIRELYAGGGRYSYYSLGRKLGISKAIVGGVLRGESWADVPQKISRAKGLSSWSVGLTKETDARVERQARSLKRTLALKRQRLELVDGGSLRDRVAGRMGRWL